MEEQSIDGGSSTNYNDTHQQQSPGNGIVSPPSPISATPDRGKVSSYASLVNQDEVTSLNFIKSSMINGVKCVKIDTEDVTPKIEYWQSAISCSVLGANPPLEIMEGFLRRIWQSLDIDLICLVKKGVFLVRFNNLEDQSTVVKKGVYYFDSKPLLVKPWNPEMDINIVSITSLTIWVRFMDLDIKY